jgi:eukaryotic-like serine/threonine-protein kinase
MQALVEAIAKSPTELAVVLGLLCLLLAVLIGIVLTAFVQGREISFWPPKIGALPERRRVEEEEAGGGSFHPVLGRGNVVIGNKQEKFRIQASIYFGSSGTIFRALDAEGHDVAVKLFHISIASDKQASEFKSEYKTAARLTHRNIIKVLGRGLCNGHPFYAMEFMAGGTLRDLLEARDRFGGAEILSVASQVAEAIDFAHESGVFHRDIKPGNILFEGDVFGRVVISDFGVAKTFAAQEAERTRAFSAILVGSPSYMAPEIIRGVPFSPQADIYSFGAVLFELIAGRKPFERFETLIALVEAKCNRDSPDIKAFRPVDDMIAAQLAATLSRDPERRPKTARAVLSGMEAALRQMR